MDQIRDLSDERLLQTCIYCGDHPDSRDHVPSRVLLTKPYPENLPVVPACTKCNSSFSLDEEYLVCAISVASAKSSEPDAVSRPDVAKILRRKPALQAELGTVSVARSTQEWLHLRKDRIENVLLKLARGHAAFELSQIVREAPQVFWWKPIKDLDENALEEFEAAEVLGAFGEVGSRSMQRAIVVDVMLRAEGGHTRNLGLVMVDWIVVQEGYYRYIATDGDGQVRVKLVIGDFLAAELCWDL